MLEVVAEEAERLKQVAFPHLSFPEYWDAFPDDGTAHLAVELVGAIEPTKVTIGNFQNGTVSLSQIARRRARAARAREK